MARPNRQTPARDGEIGQAAHVDEQDGLLHRGRGVTHRPHHGEGRHVNAGRTHAGATKGLDEAHDHLPARGDEHDAGARPVGSVHHPELW